MDAKFLLTLPISLREDIKRLAKRRGRTTNDYIVQLLKRVVEYEDKKDEG